MSGPVPVGTAPVPARGPSPGSSAKGMAGTDKAAALLISLGPDRAAEVPPEPGIAKLRRLLAPEAGDTAAPGQLQQLVRAVAEDRAPDLAYGRGRLAAYLDAPPRQLDLAEADAVITELEALPLQETT